MINGGVEVMNKGHDAQAMYKRNIANLGRVVRQKREAAGIRTADLALVAGIDQTTLSRFESGRTTPGLDTIERVITSLEFMKALALKADLVEEMGDKKVADDMRVLRPLYAKRPKGIRSECSPTTRLGSLVTIHPYATTSKRTHRKK